MNKIYSFFMLFLLLSASTLALVYIPTGDYDYKNRYSIWNVSNLTTQRVCIAGDCRTTWPTVSGGGISSISSLDVYSIVVNGTSATIQANLSAWDIYIGNRVDANGNWTEDKPSYLTATQSNNKFLQNQTCASGYVLQNATTAGAQCILQTVDTNTDNSGWKNTSSQVYLSNNATNVSIGSAPTLFVDTTNGRVSISNGNITIGNGTVSYPHLKFVKGNGFSGGIQFLLEDGTTVRGYVYLDAEEDLRLKGDEIFFEPTGKVIVKSDLNVSSTSNTNTLYADTTNGRLGVNMVPPGQFAIGWPMGTTQGNGATRFDIYGGTSNYRMQIDNNSYLMSIDMIPVGNNATAIRYWRNVNTTGAAYIDLLKADGTANSAIRLRSNGDSWFDGGDVGIGTQSPTQQLDVNGSVNVTNSIYAGVVQITQPGAIGLQILSGASGSYSRMNLGRTGTTDGLDIGVAGASGHFQTGSAAGDVTVRIPSSTNTSKIFISSTGGLGQPTTFVNGKVGINTISPSTTLDVNGSVNVTGEIYIGNAVVCRSDGTNCPASVGDNSSWNESYAETLYLRNTGDTATGNYTFDTSTLKVDATNNYIGIGTASPSTRLHISSTTDNVIRLQATDDSWQYIEFYNSTGRTAYTGIDTTGHYEIGGADVDILKNINILNNLTVGGSVGLGSNNPTTKLDVKGNVLFVNTNSTDVIPGLKIEKTGAAGSSNLYLQTGHSDTVTRWFINATGASSTNKFYVDYSGNGYFRGQLRIDGLNGTVNATVCVNSTGQFYTSATTCGLTSSETDPVWNGNASRVTNLEQANITLNASVTSLIQRVTDLNTSTTANDSAQLSLIQAAQGNITVLLTNVSSLVANDSAQLVLIQALQGNVTILNTSIGNSNTAIAALQTANQTTNASLTNLIARVSVLNTTIGNSSSTSVFQLNRTFRLIGGRNTSVECVNDTSYNVNCTIHAIDTVGSSVGFSADQDLNRTSNVTFNRVNITATAGDALVAYNSSGYTWLGGNQISGANWRLLDPDGNVLADFSKASDSATFLNLFGVSSYAGAVGLTAKAAASQTANIFEILDSSSNKLLIVNGTGYLGIGTTTLNQKVTLNGSINVSDSVYIGNSREYWNGSCRIINNTVSGGYVAYC